jgi:hypothetical protein
VGDVSVVGCVGSLIVATRGIAGPEEVLLTERGSKEAYLAWWTSPCRGRTATLYAADSVNTNPAMGPTRSDSTRRRMASPDHRTHNRMCLWGTGIGEPARLR